MKSFWQGVKVHKDQITVLRNRLIPQQRNGKHASAKLLALQEKYLEDLIDSKLKPFDRFIYASLAWGHKWLAYRWFFTMYFKNKIKFFSKPDDFGTCGLSYLRMVEIYGEKIRIDHDKDAMPDSDTLANIIPLNMSYFIAHTGSRWTEVMSIVGRKIHNSVYEYFEKGEGKCLQACWMEIIVSWEYDIYSKEQGAIQYKAIQYGTQKLAELFGLAVEKNIVGVGILGSGIIEMAPLLNTRQAVLFIYPLSTLESRYKVLDADGNEKEMIGTTAVAEDLNKALGTLAFVYEGGTDKAPVFNYRSEAVEVE